MFLNCPVLNKRTKITSKKTKDEKSTSQIRFHLQKVDKINNAVLLNIEVFREFKSNFLITKEISPGDLALNLCKKYNLDYGTLEKIKGKISEIKEKYCKSRSGYHKGDEVIYCSSYKHKEMKVNKSSSDTIVNNANISTIRRNRSGISLNKENATLNKKNLILGSFSPRNNMSPKNKENKTLNKTAQNKTNSKRKITKKSPVGEKTKCRQSTQNVINDYNYIKKEDGKTIGKKKEEKNSKINNQNKSNIAQKSERHMIIAGKVRMNELELNKLLGKIIRQCKKDNVFKNKFITQNSEKELMKNKLNKNTHLSNAPILRMGSKNTGKNSNNNRRGSNFCKSCYNSKGTKRSNRSNNSSVKSNRGKKSGGNEKIKNFIINYNHNCNQNVNRNYAFKYQQLLSPRIKVDKVKNRHIIGLRKSNGIVNKIINININTISAKKSTRPKIPVKRQHSSKVSDNFQMIRNSSKSIITSITNTINTLEENVVDEEFKKQMLNSMKISTFTSLYKIMINDHSSQILSNKTLNLSKLYDKSLVLSVLNKNNFLTNIISGKEVYIIDNFINKINVICDSLTSKEKADFLKELS